MAGLSATQTRKILEVYHGFDGIATLVDVGGGKGATLNKIVLKYPSIKGINFDLPQVIEHAPFYPSACHNWSDKSCIKLLKNCYKALPANGKPGGKERIEKQFVYLCKGAGFTGLEVAARAVSALGVIEFTK
ncbi:hypothetical protein NL676_028031 [Syzygium grande]|nr:hypothetical protein NL676_028031 [Syzygium grande]